jgi:methionyl-tRNA formyltransferase
MKEVGAQLLVKTIEGLADGSLKETPQSAISNRQSTNDDSDITETHSQLTRHPEPAEGQPLRHAPKIFTETCKIDWNEPIDKVHNLIRGLSPFPGAFSYLGTKMLKIYRSGKEHAQPALQPGAFETDKKTFLKFACADGFIDVKELQLEGKKKMMVDEFLRGYRFE